MADFVGVPSINWFPGQVVEDAGGRKFVCKSLRVAAPAGLAPGRAVSLAIRPQDLSLVPPEEADLLGLVDVVEALGSALVVHARSPDGTSFRVVVPAEEKLRVGDPIRARLRTEGVHFFDAESGLRLLRPGD